MQLVEQLRPHGEAGDQPGDVVGRAADQPVSGIRDRLHGAHAAREILAGAAAQPLQADALAVLLERQQFALGRIGLEVVKRRDGSRGVAEGGMAGDVIDPLGADIDDAPVAHALKSFSDRSQAWRSLRVGPPNAKAGYPVITEGN